MCGAPSSYFLVYVPFYRMNVKGVCDQNPCGQVRRVRISFITYILLQYDVLLYLSAN
jgi:hypothetical protein